MVDSLPLRTRGCGRAKLARSCGAPTGYNAAGPMLRRVNSVVPVRRCGSAAMSHARTGPRPCAVVRHRARGSTYANPIPAIFAVASGVAIRRTSASIPRQRKTRHDIDLYALKIRGVDGRPIVELRSPNGSSDRTRAPRPPLGSQFGAAPRRRNAKGGTLMATPQQRRRFRHCGLLSGEARAARRRLALAACEPRPRPGRVSAARRYGRRNAAGARRLSALAASCAVPRRRGGAAARRAAPRQNTFLSGCWPRVTSG
jgi:hypothetical protein